MRWFRSEVVQEKFEVLDLNFDEAELQRRAEQGRWWGVGVCVCVCVCVSVCVCECVGA